jgi:hypothetical protein
MSYIPDIVTDKNFVECKEIDFEKLAHNSSAYKARIKDILNQLEVAILVGHFAHKKILLMSPRMIPCNVAEKIRGMGIEIIDGY